MVFNNFDAYCSAVCVMVRQKRCHALITSELTAHMEDHADALLAKGADPDEARRAAVAAMGDPYEVGKQLDKLYSPWYPRLTRIFTVLAAIFVLLGIIIGRDNFLFDRRFAPFADPAKLVLVKKDYEVNAQLMATGTAVGGGQIGSYHFSPTGAAAIFRTELDMGERLQTSYELRVVVSALCPFFWLDGLDGINLSGRAWDGDSALTDATPYLSALPEQGLFRRFYCVTLTIHDPTQRSFTVEVEDTSYTIKLKEVAAP